MTEENTGLCTLKGEGQALCVGEQEGVVVGERRRGGVTCTGVLQQTGTTGGAETKKPAASGANCSEGLSNHRKEGNVPVGGEGLCVVAVLQLLGVAGGREGSGGRSREVRRSLWVSYCDVNGKVSAGARVGAGDVRAGAGAQETGVLNLHREARLTRNGCHLTLEGVVNVGGSTTAGATEDVGGDRRVKWGG